MEKSNDKDLEEKKIYQVKTITVPFALGKIKENISISTNTQPKPSSILLANQINCTCRSNHACTRKSL